MLSMRWGGRERNAAVLRNTLMWGLVLSSGNSEMVMHVGSSELRVAAVPAHSGLNVGISADSIRLARILGGEGAGETGPVGAAATDELDGIAILRDIESDESRVTLRILKMAKKTSHRRRHGPRRPPDATSYWRHVMQLALRRFIFESPSCNSAAISKRLIQKLDCRSSAQRI